MTKMYTSEVCTGWTTRGPDREKWTGLGFKQNYTQNLHMKEVVMRHVMSAVIL